MIYTYTSHIKGTESCLTVVLLDKWNRENIKEATKLSSDVYLYQSDDFIRDNYYLTFSVLRREYIIIADYNNFTFGIRLMAGWDICRAINPNRIKTHLVAVSKIIKDAHMARTEDIIREAKP